MKPFNRDTNPFDDLDAVIDRDADSRLGDFLGTPGVAKKKLAQDHRRRIAAAQARRAQDAWLVAQAKEMAAAVKRGRNKPADTKEALREIDDLVDINLNSGFGRSKR